MTNSGYARSLLLAAACAMAVPLAAAAQDRVPAGARPKVDFGKVEFESKCATCHGVDGKGRGPTAPFLNRVAADLTGLAKANGGVLPVSAMYDVIVGDKDVGAHGSRDMPVWGNRYRVRVEAKETDATIERRATEQIDALVRYLRSIQAK